MNVTLFWHFYDSSFRVTLRLVIVKTTRKEEFVGYIMEVVHYDTQKFT